MLKHFEILRSSLTLGTSRVHNFSTIHHHTKSAETFCNLLFRVKLKLKEMIEIKVFRQFPRNEDRAVFKILIYNIQASDSNFVTP